MERGPDGRFLPSHRRRDNALLKTIKESAAQLGAGLALAPIAVPLIGLIPPLTALAAISNLLAPLSMPAMKAAEYKLNKKIPDADGKDIMHTELEFDLAGVSAQRRRWSEYLIACYGALHQWRDMKGFAHPEQIAAGAAYSARTGGYPRPWSEAPREQQLAGRKPSRRARRPARPGRGARVWREISDRL